LSKNNRDIRPFVAGCALLLTAMLWGGGFVAGKMALAGAAPLPILAWRFCGAAVLCFVLFPKRILTADRQTIRRAVMIGGIQMLSLSLQLTGLQYTSSAKQSFLCTAYVAMVPFISWLLLGQKPGLRAFLAGVIALAGIGLISLNGLTGVNRGDALSLAFAVGFGVQIVLVGKYVARDTDSVALSFYQMLSCGTAALLLCLFTGAPLTLRGGEAFAGVAYLIVGNTLLAFTLQNAAQKYTRDTIAALLLSLESVFGFVFSVLYYRDTLSLRLLLGCGLCFAAILISTLGGNSTPPTDGGKANENL